MLLEHKMQAYQAIISIGFFYFYCYYGWNRLLLEVLYCALEYLEMAFLLEAELTYLLLYLVGLILRIIEYGTFTRYYVCV